MTTITASVVLYNTPDLQLRRLVECIEKSSVRPHLFIIDNSPQPSTITSDSKWITYVKAESNRGYGAGHNIALRRVLDESEFHFVLNPDIYFGGYELEKMIEFMKQDPTIGQLMPKVTYPDGAVQYLCKLLPTPADLFLRRFMLGSLKKIVRERLEKFELRFTGYDREMDVPYLSGCFMLFRISAIRKVGLFDERFFMYPEDMDMTRRIHATFRTVFYPGALVVHDHAKASYKSSRALLVHISNMVKYFNKWGWIRDPIRSKVNEDTLRRLNY